MKKKIIKNSLGEFRLLKSQIQVILKKKLKKQHKRKVQAYSYKKSHQMRSSNMAQILFAQNSSMDLKRVTILAWVIEV